MIDIMVIIWNVLLFSFDEPRTQLEEHQNQKMRLINGCILLLLEQIGSFPKLYDLEIKPSSPTPVWTGNDRGYYYFN